MKKAVTGAGEAPGARKMARAGFTLSEVMMAAVVVGIGFLAVFASFNYGFAVIKLNRENLRATQILQEKMEMARLYNWSEVTNNWIPTNFTDYFDPTASTNSEGAVYSGTVTLTNAPITETYASDLRMLKVMVTWTNGNVTRERDMMTFISHYGLQTYIY